MNVYAIESQAIPAHGIDVEELEVEHITLLPIHDGKDNDITEWLEQQQEDAELGLIAYEMMCANKFDMNYSEY